MDGYIFILREGDIDKIKSYKKSINDISDSVLIEEYNREFDIGITGVHQQALFLIVLNNQFKVRFNNSPISIDNNYLISFNGKVKAVTDDRIEYEASFYKSFSTVELIERYNKEYKRGFLGIMMQRGYIIELGKEFCRRFKDTPLKNNVFKGVSFKGEVKTIINNKINYERH